MKMEKQQRVTVVLIVFTAALLLIAQFLLLFTLRTMGSDLKDAKDQVAGLTRTNEERQQLSNSYKKFEEYVASSSKQKNFPVSALELYTMIDSVLTNYGIEHTNQASTAVTTPGAELRLTITFRGSYYNILKALASLRDAPIVLRVDTFTITAQPDGRTSGSFVLVSRLGS
jgi:hypothetical protein